MAETALYDLQTLAKPQVVNGLILALQSRAVEKTNGYQTDLVAIKGDETKVVEQNVTAFSVRGQRVLYLQKGQLYSHLEGGQTTRLTNTTATVTQFEPLPETGATYVTVVSDAEPFNTVSAEPSVRRYTKRNFKADNEGFIDEARVFELHVATESETDRLVLRYDLPVKLLDATDRMAYLAKQVSDEDADEVHTILVAVDLETGAEYELTGDEFAQVLEAQVAPDGKHVLVIAFDQQFPNHRAAGLYVINVTDGVVTTVFDAEELLDGPNSDLTVVGQDRHVRWLNTTQFVFETGYYGHTRLYLASLAGDFTRLSDLPQRLDDFTIVEDHLLAVQQDTAHPSRLVTIDLVNGNQELVYDANPSFDFEPATKFNFASEDGTPVDGWFMAAQSEGPAPVVLYVHGGPHAAYGEAFFWEFQEFTAAGYNVVFTNPHGSTTYGQAFINAVVGHYGEQDYRDVLAGLDTALKEFADKIDATKQVIIGGSYGGFMTTWAIGHTDRFQSAISQRPVTEWLSMTGASDIGYNFVFDEMGATPYSEAGRAELTFRSPLTYVANVKTPLLMMHGEYDMRTPIAQTEMYYVAMKTLTDTPVEMVRFPQAWHGVSRNGLPNLRNARLDVMFDWLQRTFAD